MAEGTTDDCILIYLSLFCLDKILWKNIIKIMLVLWTNATIIQLLPHTWQPYLHTYGALSANLGCRSETCCMRLAENAGRKKSPKSRHLRTIVQSCRAISSQVKHISTIGKKLVKHSNMSSTCPHNMVNFGILAAEIGPVVWGTP